MPKSVLNKKKSLKGKVTKIKDKVKDKLNDAEIQLYNKKCEQFSEDLSKIFDNILSNCEDEETDKFIEEQLSIQEDIDDIWLSINSQLVKPNSATVSRTSNGENVKLPKLSLPSFNGNIQDWLSFSDLFKASVHKNENLTRSMKLQYLKGLLTGDVSRVIQSITISDANYLTAWTLLEDRFSNKRDQVFAHLKRFMSIPALQSDSASSVLNLIDTTYECVRSLQTLGYEVEQFAEVMFVYMLHQKLDASSKLWFEREFNKSKEIPSLKELLDFLKNYVCTSQSSRTSTNLKRNVYSKNTSLVISNVKNSKPKCAFCNNDIHAIYKCEEFLKLSVDDKVLFLKQKSLCFNCFKGHNARICNSKGNCKKCFKCHNTLIHFDQGRKATSFGTTSVNIRDEVNLEPSQQVSNHSSLNPAANTFQMFPNNDPSFRSPLLLGERSSYTDAEKCVLLKNLVGLLGVERQKTDAVISCLNHTSVRVKTQLKTDISNLTGDYIRKIDFLVVPKITRITSSKCLDISALNLPPNITLADPHFYKPGKIDLLLGNEYFCEFLRPGQCRVPNSQLILQNSVFGFLASGRLNVTGNQSSRVIQCKLIANLEDLHKDMTKFWELEKIEKPIKSVEEEKCEKHFLRTYSRNSEGRYIVQLLKKDPECLGESKTSALGSLNSLWRRLSKYPELLSLYRDFMQEYEALGHMELVTDNNEPSTSYYLPHHGVFKPDKTSTKLQVVFNASALNSNGLSLNAIQMNGGLTQEDLFSIMLRFRKHKFVFSADIRKMYRMILVDPQQRDLQRIVWKNGKSDTVKTYKLNTVTYGTTSAPYLATRVLHQLVKDEGQCFPLAATVLDSDFYMDDVLTGGDSLEEVRELQIQLIRLVARAGMELHKWRTNASNLRSNISEEKEYSFLCSSETKALGILWNDLTDCFSFKVLPSPQNTKRAVLSNIAKIFDPLGLLGPVITVAKIFLQRLWKLKIDWNVSLPE
ncbi:hypothetical protein AVEN_60237-1 [Araneus ventricosus]|uniref:Uncharacterized protein n=1 Tax=Araneus ventricosus TaxID=182803 RepID=A0A4Y2CKV9_ARAVE|nr:hypothetical protein AVEN_60237-1 [Araneus ventricosus]